VTPAHCITLSGYTVWCFYRSLDIELALRIYRQQGDAAMVLGLEKVLHIEV
jgi:hypothetical protein